MANSLIRLLVSAVLALSAAILVFAALPAELDVRTDIVGYPTFADFNIDLYFWAYGLVVVFLPLATWVIYLLLTRTLVARRALPRPIPPPVERIEMIPAPTRGRILVAVGRTLLLGGVIGIEAAIVVDVSSGWALVGMLLYGTAVAVAALVATRVSRRDPVDVVSTFNTLASPLAVLMLYGVSESTRVTISATGVVHAYPWLPAWLAVGAAVALLLWLAIRLARSGSPAERSLVERGAMVLVVAPVGLFLFLSALPGALGSVDLFEEGQVLAGYELTREGSFPWRDLLLAHGLFHDVFIGLVGSSVFEDSRWGVVAGQTVLIEPLSWVALYYLCVYLFGSNWLFLLGTQLLVISGHVFAIHSRFALLPFVLLLLAALLQRATVTRAVAFTSLLLLQVIVTPEALAAAAAFLAVLALFDSYYYERGQGLARGFRRTWLCLASLVVLAAGWSAFLLAHGALDDFLFSYRAFLPGHRLTGGIPRRTLPGDEFEIAAPVILVVGAFAFLVIYTRLRRRIALTDWVALATAALALLYYAKFLSRADYFHLYHSFSVAVPLLFYAAYRCVTAVEASLATFARAQGASWWPARHTVTLPLLLVLLVSAPISVLDASRAVRAGFMVAVPAEPEIDRIGFTDVQKVDKAGIQGLATSLESLLHPGETLFDFTNTPGLFHYVFDFPAATRYFHVSMAIRHSTQSDLVRRLAEVRPAAVVFTNRNPNIRGLASWDRIANQVRHYEVSEYLLDNYVPVDESQGFVVLRRREAGARTRRELYFGVDPCDWGYVPNFLRAAASSSEAVAEVPFRRLPLVLRIRGWAIDPRAALPAAQVVATLDGRVIARVRPQEPRSAVAYESGVSGYGTAGFSITLPAHDVEGARSDLARVRVYAVSRSGEASELSPGAGPSAKSDGSDRLDLGKGRSAPLVADPSRGRIETAGVEQPLALTIPGGAAKYRWLEVRTGRDLREGRFELVDRPKSAPNHARGIFFSTLERGETSVRVLVGACSQWRGYRPGVLYLTSSPDQDIREIRLLR